MQNLKKLLAILTVASILNDGGSMAWNYDYTDGYTGWTLYGPEQTENAQLCFNALSRATSPRITKQAAAGIVGNFTWESGLNTGQWEHGYNMDPESGFGLGQWTPSTKYTNWLTTDTIEERVNGDNQIDFLLAKPEQWSTYYVDMETGYSSYYDVTVPILPTMADYFRSTEDPETLAVAWMVYWERGDAQSAHFEQRQDYARYWFDNLNYSNLIWLYAKAANRWRTEK